MDNEKNTAPRTYIGQVPVYCAFDKIVDIEKVVPNPRNPNQHPKAQVELLAKIIKAQGWRNAIMVSTRSGFIVKGHGRLAAARTLQEEQVPVEYQNYESEASEMADLTADNRLAELSEMNNTMLADILSDIDTGEFPLELSGYDEEDLEGILEAITGEDDAEPNDQDNEYHQQAAPMSRPGDLWLLGQHRLLCGDATNPDNMERLMDGEKAEMVHTDPPYGVSYETQSGRFDVIENDDVTGEDLSNKVLGPVFRLMSRYTIDKAAFYVWYAIWMHREFEDALNRAGIVMRQQIIWAKANHVLGRSDYQWMHEPCMYAAKDGETPNFYGDRSNFTVWRVTQRNDGDMLTTIGNGLVLTDGKSHKLYCSAKPPKNKKLRYVRTKENQHVDLYQEDKLGTVWEASIEPHAMHPTQKPVEIPTRAIENSSQPGGIVLDPFGGSGSTLIAADDTGRRCFTMEIDPVYADVIVSRYVLHTKNIGVTCIRDGKEIRYLDLVKEWAVENGRESEIMQMKTPVVVVKKGATDHAKEESDKG